MSIYKARQIAITLGAGGTGAGDISLADVGGAARLVSHYLSYSGTAAGTSVQLSSAQDGRNIGSAIVGNTAVETAVDKIIGKTLHIVVTAGTQNGIVTITAFFDAV